jgi:hypothetical protein
MVSAKQGRVSYGRVVCDDVADNWVVRGPQRLTGKLMFWTQPDEEAARRFYDRLRMYLET